MEVGTYIKCFGQCKSDGEGMMTAYSCRPLTTFNEVTHHITKVAYCFRQLSNGQPQSMDMAGAQQTSSNNMVQVNDDASDIPLYSQIQQVLSRGSSDTGCSITEILQAIGQDK